MRSVILLFTFTVVCCIALIAQTNEKRSSVDAKPHIVSFRTETPPDYSYADQLGQPNTVSNDPLLNVSQFNNTKGKNAAQSTSDYTVENQGNIIIWYITVFSGVLFLLSLIALRYVWDITTLGSSYNH